MRCRIIYRFTLRRTASFGEKFVPGGEGTQKGVVKLPARKGRDKEG